MRVARACSAGTAHTVSRMLHSSVLVAEANASRTEGASAIVLRRSSNAWMPGGEAHTREAREQLAAWHAARAALAPDASDCAVVPLARRVWTANWAVMRFKSCSSAATRVSNSVLRRQRVATAQYTLAPLASASGAA